MTVFDPLGSAAASAEAHNKLAALVGALLVLLEEKGVVSGPDLERLNKVLLPKVQAHMDQEIARKVAEQRAQLEKESPLAALLLRSLERPGTA